MSELVLLPGPRAQGQSRAASVAATRRARPAMIALAVALLLSFAPALSLTGTISTVRADEANPAEAFEALMYPSTQSPAAPAPTTPTTGDAIAGFATQFLGYPYVYAGNTPAGFDCSGFTQYVVLNVTGLDIGHGTEGQLAYGVPVAADALLPGDLIYFAGTWGPGITHTGIYIGDGLFIHAENESTGVVISDLWGSFGGYYYTAIRVW